MIIACKISVPSRRSWRVCLLWLLFISLARTAHSNAWAEESDRVVIPDQALEQVVQSGESAAQIPTKSLLDMVLAGGPLLIPLLVCSFVLLLVVFERTVNLRRARVIPSPFVKRFLHQLREGQLDRNDALHRCEQNSSHVARVFASAVRKWGRPAVEVEQALIDEGERTAARLRRYLRVMNGVATVSPLVGLLGTVWGMMVAFNSIATASAMGRPELLAAGISQALLTTAAGLFIAIPALIFYLFFAGRVDHLVSEIDQKGQELVSIISAEAKLDSREPRKAQARRAA